MKQIYTLSLILFSFTAFSQQKNVNSSTNSQSTPSEQKNSEISTNTSMRSTDVSAQNRISQPVKLPYDVNDKYMGRADEFIGNLTVSTLPSDFPVYEKQWDVKAYNQVVTAFYYNHLDIVKESVRKKLEILQH